MPRSDHDALEEGPADVGHHEGGVAHALADRLRLVQQVRIVRVGPIVGVEIPVLGEWGHADEVALFVGVVAGTPPIEADGAILAVAGLVRQVEAREVVVEPCRQVGHIDPEVVRHRLAHGAGVVELCRQAVDLLIGQCPPHALAPGQLHRSSWWGVVRPK